MQSTIESKLNKNQNLQQSNRGRRRRPRNRRKQKNIVENEIEECTFLDKESVLNLTDLASEAHALEKQLSELQKQLKFNHSNVPSKEKGRIAVAIAIEQIATTEDEIDYVRQSLKKTYRQILNTDLTYATNYHIEDKTWRYIFYSDIESIRSKLRQKQGDIELEKKLLMCIESAFKFYRELNSKIKTKHHIEDTKVFGIEQFKHQDNEKLGQLLQFNYICLGDLSRYHAQQAMQNKNKKYKEYWELAKTCYLKAVDVLRVAGKPYCQLALVSMSNGNAIDVVWYYCMSLAVKFPSSVARDNLNSFYSKLKPNSSKAVADQTPITLISQFVESFLHMHKSIMFPHTEESEEFPDILEITSKLGQAFHDVVLDQDEKTNMILHILKTTLTRTITISMVSIWISGEQLKDKSNYSLRPQILSSQVYLYTFVFSLLKSTYRSTREAFETLQDTALEPMVDGILLQALGIWSIFISSNLTALAQHCSASRHRDSEKKKLVGAVQSLVSLLVSHPAFPDPVLNTLPSTFPISEDLHLLGCAPLISFHQTVDFFKEKVYETEQTPEANKQVRWGRTFDFIQYNQNEHKYSIVDENAKRQQQNRFMKALATQRLIDQVSCLEKNVNRLTAPIPASSVSSEPRDLYTCLVDVTVFLDGLSKVKKWANQSAGQCDLEIIVPLEVIDLLDDFKKGNSHMNMQARESIRYLDELLKNAKVKDFMDGSSLRTQKLSEKLSDWNDAENYWIGESLSKKFDNLLLSEHEESDDDAVSVASSNSSSSSILAPRSRRTRDELSDIESSSEEEVYDFEDLNEDSYDEVSTFDEIPIKYRHFLSCVLYFYKMQEKDQAERLVLVTNDEDLMYWAEMFGNSKTEKKLLVKTVSDWDKLVSSIDFG